MESVSYLMFWTGLWLVVIAGAALIWQSVTLQVRRPALSAGGSFPLPTLLFEPQVRNPMSTVATWGAVAFLGGSILFRAFAAGRPPYGNLWEYFEVLSFGILLAYSLAQRNRTIPGLGLIILPVVAAVLITAELWFPHELTPLVPALENNRLLAIHVASMLVAYSALTVAFGAALLYLWQASRRRSLHLPDLDVLEDACHRAIQVGFPILGLGIALGAYWGNIAWGRYWGWDPKETTALISWLIFAGYMHARVLNGWQGRRTMALVILGYSAIIFNIFVVNFVIAGLHSYAGV